MTATLQMLLQILRWLDSPESMGGCAAAWAGAAVYSALTGDDPLFVALQVMLAVGLGIYAIRMPGREHEETPDPKTEGS